MEEEHQLVSLLRLTAGKKSGFLVLTETQCIELLTEIERLEDASFDEGFIQGMPV